MRRRERKNVGSSSWTGSDAALLGGKARLLFAGGTRGGATRTFRLHLAEAVFAHAADLTGGIALALREFGDLRLSAKPRLIGGRAILVGIERGGKSLGATKLRQGTTRAARGGRERAAHAGADLVEVVGVEHLGDGLHDLLGRRLVERKHDERLVLRDGIAQAPARLPDRRVQNAAKVFAVPAMD